MKPPEVSRAICIAWISLVIGLPKLLMDWPYIRAQAPATFIVLTSTFSCGITILLIWKTAQGRNWARITLLVLFLLALFPSFFIARSELARAPLVGAISSAQIGFQGLALFFLFTNPGKAWFHGVRPPTSSTESNLNRVGLKS
jgi:hypothetical protein